MPPKKDKPKRPKQQRLPGEVGNDPKSIPAIDKKADELDEPRTERIELGKKEAALQAELVALMHAHKLEVYKYDHKTVKLAGKETVKVKKDKTAIHAEEV